MSALGLSTNNRYLQLHSGNKRLQFSVLHTNFTMRLLDFTHLTLVINGTTSVKPSLHEVRQKFYSSVSNIYDYLETMRSKRELTSDDDSWIDFNKNSWSTDRILLFVIAGIMLIMGGSILRSFRQYCSTIGRERQEQPRPALHVEMNMNAEVQLGLREQLVMWEPGNVTPSLPERGNVTPLLLECSNVAVSAEVLSEFGELTSHM